MRPLPVLCLVALAACSAVAPPLPPLLGSAAFAVTAAPALSPLRGPSLAGAEFGVDPWGAGTLPGVAGTHYTWPTAGEAVYWRAHGATAFRLPFRIERVQPVALGPLDAPELGRLSTLVAGLGE